MNDIATTARLTLVLAVSALVLAGCFRLPNEQTADEVPDPAAISEEALRSLTSFEDLGTCTEDGWSGVIVSTASSPLTGTISVTFIGLGSVDLGTGSTLVSVEPEGSSEFLVVPDPPLDDFAFSCTIELAEIAVTPTE